MNGPSNNEPIKRTHELLTLERIVRFFSSVRFYYAHSCCPLFVVVVIGPFFRANRRVTRSSTMTPRHFSLVSAVWLSIGSSAYVCFILAGLASSCAELYLFLLPRPWWHNKAIHELLTERIIRFLFFLSYAFINKYVPKTEKKPAPSSFFFFPFLFFFFCHCGLSWMNGVRFTRLHWLMCQQFLLVAFLFTSLKCYCSNDFVSSSFMVAQALPLIRKEWTLLIGGHLSN